MTDLKGNLQFIGLGELLQLLGGNLSTGRINLISPHLDYPGNIYLIDGNPVNAEAGNFKGLEAINRLFGWIDADYEFIKESVNCERLIKKSRMEIILDALRMVDDGEIPILPEAKDKEKYDSDSDEDSNIPIIKGPLVDYIYVVDEEEFSAGKEIVNQEKFGNWFWVILEGKADVIRLMPDGKVPISRLSDGAFIGSIGSFMRKGSLQRSATVVAVTNVQLGVMDYDLLFKQYSELTPMFQVILASFDNRLRQITTNCAKALLHGLSAEEYRPDNLTPFEQKNDEDAAYQIQNGQAVVVRRINNGFIKLCELETNDVVGHIPFLNTCHEPHSATVYVSSDFEFKPIDLKSVRKEYNQMSQTFKNVIQHTTTSISVTTGRLFDTIKGGKGGYKEREV